MTETTARIAWSYDAGLYLWSGSVGTLGAMFRIVAPLIEGRGFLLASDFPGQERKRRDGDDLGELQAEAERWLEEFVTSLGATFPDAPARPSRTWHSDWRLVSRDAEGNMILKYVPADALYCVLPVEES